MARKSGTSANDELIGGEGDDRLYGRDGDDRLEGGAGNDRLYGGDGRDQLIGGAGTDRFWGGDGDDVLDGDVGNDRLHGGDGHDQLLGGAGDDRLDAGRGDDRLEGGAGDDRLDGQAGDDQLLGGAGDDRLDAGRGDDRLEGGAGDDRLDGQAGDDRLFGGDGDDYVLGGHGDDTLEGGAGDDALFGNAGDDLFVYRTGDGNDEVIGGRGSDTVRLEVDDGWMVNLTKGAIVADEDGQVQLSGRATGTITLADGSTIGFRDIERIEAVAGEPGDGGQPPIGLELVAEPVDEDAPDGSVVGTVGASDPDAGDTLTYSLTDDAGGRFAIDPDSGVITVADGAALDYESAAQHSIEVTVTDAGGHSATRSFAIDVADVNEAPGGLSLDASAVAENAPAGTVVGTVGASDPDAGDTLTYALTDDAGGRFAIDPDTGVITVAAPKPDAPAEPVASWLLDSSLDGQDQKVVIGHDPRLELDQGTVAVRFTADHVSGEQELFSKDSLGFDDGGHLSVWLEDGQVVARLQSASESFHLRSAPGAVSAEEPTQVAVSFGDAGFRLYVGGELVDQSSYTGGIADNREPLVVGADAQRSGDGTADNLSHFFAGTIHELAVYDRQMGAEQPPGAGTAPAEHGIEVTVTDAGGLSASQTFNITVTDVGEPPSIGVLDSNVVAEKAPGGTVVGTVDASDPDAGDTLTYSLSDDAGGRFAIDSDTGVITVADGAALDYESAPQHGIEVTVTDAGGHSATRSFTIAVADVNEAPSIAGLDSDQVAEDATGGTVVGTVAASDPDVGDTLTFRLSDDAGGRFAIDPDTGAISVASGAAFDFENAMQHEVEVEVTDAGGLGATRSVTIAVTNVNEQPLIEALSSNEVIEGAADGTVVGTVSALDPDGDPGLSYVLSDDAGGRFAIDPDTGVITVADGSLLNYDAADQHGIEVTVTDPGGLSHVATYVIELLKDNSGDDHLLGGDGDDLLDGGPGDDILEGGAGEDHLIGGTGNDFLFGNNDDDQLFGGLGDDQLRGGNGNDVMDGGAGNDQLFGNAGNDQINAGADNDAVFGSLGNDVLNGGDGDDSLFGGMGDDVLTGGAGNDILAGDDSSDFGADRFVFASLDGSVDEILDFGAGNDVLAIGEMLVDLAAHADEAAFVRLVDDGTDTTVWVDVDGAANGEAYQPIVVLTGVREVSLDDMVSAGQIDFWMS